MIHAGFQLYVIMKSLATCVTNLHTYVAMYVAILQVATYMLLYVLYDIIYV